MSNPRVFNTGDVGSTFISGLVYGLAGAGKTPLAATMPGADKGKCMVVTSEPGLLSLKRARMPYILGRDYDEALAAIAWLKTKECAGLVSVYFDSISALSENILNKERIASKNDARKFSPATHAKTIEVILQFLSIEGKHRWMTSKAVEIDQGRSVQPYAAVPKLGPDLPYYFDNVVYLSRHRDPQTNVENVAFRCQANDYSMSTRNRDGALALWEPANFAHIINKINGVASS